MRAEEEACLRAKEEAWEKAWREEEVWVQEQAHLAVEARAQEEEQRVCEEEERSTVEQDFHEVEGPSQERVPQRWLFLPSSDSAGSPEEEERVESPPRDKGKGRVLAPEEVLGEVTGVICDLCDKKGIPCRWGKVSIPYIFQILLTSLHRRQPMFGPA